MRKLSLEESGVFSSIQCAALTKYDIRFVDQFIVLASIAAQRVGIARLIGMPEEEVSRLVRQLEQALADAQQVDADRKAVLRFVAAALQPRELPEHIRRLPKVDPKR